MPINKTTSPLAKKYGQKKVVRARNLLQAQMGLKQGGEAAGKKIQWGVVGKIVQDEVKGHKVVKKSDIEKAKKRVSSEGKTPSAKRYLKESTTRKVSRETSKSRKSK